MAVETRTKRCSVCRKHLPVKEFHKDVSRKDGLQRTCKTCRPVTAARWRKAHREKENSRQRRWNRDNPSKSRLFSWRARLKKKYDMTEEQYTERLNKQNGLCAVCGKVPKKGMALVVEHDHVTNEVRGLVHNNCNLVLGFAGDSIEVLQGAIKYLRRGYSCQR